MPRFNGTGPWWGHGPGTGHGCGFGFRRFHSPKNELVALETEEKVLEEELEALRTEKAALKDQQ